MFKEYILLPTSFITNYCSEGTMLRSKYYKLALYHKKFDQHKRIILRIKMQQIQREKFQAVFSQ